MTKWSPHQARLPVLAMHIFSGTGSMQARHIGIAVALMACAAGAHSAPVVNGFDLATFDFDVTQYGFVTSEFVDSTASGTSNGVSWSIGPTSLWSGRTTTNGSFVFSALPNPTDNLHPSANYTITFAQPIDTLIVALSNDNTTDSINFGLTPSFTQGVSVAGTQITLNSAAGGLAWFTNVNSLTINNVNVNGVDDGYDLAFHAIPAEVPEPATHVLVLSSLATFGLIAWRRRQQ